MRRQIVPTLLLLTGLASAPAWAGIDRVKSGPSCAGNCALQSYSAKVRRGLTYTWVFTGSGLQGADRVVTGGNGITGSVLTKTITEATVNLAFAPSTPLGGRAVTVQAGNQVLGSFAIEIGHLGRVDRISPESIPTGTQSVVRILGKDIEGGQLDSLPAGLNSRVARRSADEIQVEFNPSVSYTGTGARVQLYERHGDGARTPWQKTLHLAVQPSLATGGGGCQPYAATDAYIKPNLSTPGNGYLFAPLTGVQTMRQVTFAWRALIADRTADKFILEYHLRGARTLWTRVEVPGSRTDHTTNLGKGVWEWRVRIGNCGQSAPFSDTWSFTVR